MAVALQRRVEEMLRIRLGDPQREREGGVVEAEIVERERGSEGLVHEDAGAGAGGAVGEEVVGEGVAGEELEGAGLDDEGARLRGAGGGAVEDAEGDGLEGEFEGEGCAGGAGADD